MSAAPASSAAGADRMVGPFEGGPHVLQFHLGMPTYVVTAYGEDATYGEVRVISVATSPEEAMRDASRWAHRNLGYSIKRKSWTKEDLATIYYRSIRWSYDYPKAADEDEDRDDWCQFRITWTPFGAPTVGGRIPNPAGNGKGGK